MLDVSSLTNSFGIWMALVYGIVTCSIAALLLISLVLVLVIVEVKLYKLLPVSDLDHPQCGELCLGEVRVT